MKITDFRILKFQIPLIKPFKTSLRRVDVLDSIIVEIKTDEGLIGYGETAPTKAVTGEDEESITKALNIIKKSITGFDVEDFEALLDKTDRAVDGNFSAKSAVEIALYDIRAKSFDLPLFKLLGGVKREFKTTITISLNDVDKMVQDSIEALNQGYESLKIKLGNDYKEDIVRTKEIYKATKASIKLDANQGWTPKETLMFLDSIKDVKVDFIEQPVDRYDIEGLKYIKDRTNIKVLADESAFSIKDTISLLERDAIDLINIKLDKCGGISKALIIVDICKEYDKECMIGCMLEGKISILAATSVASAKSDTIKYYDLDAPFLCKTSPVVTSAEFKAPYITLSDKSSLGIEKIEKGEL